MEAGGDERMMSPAEYGIQRRREQARQRKRRSREKKGQSVLKSEGVGGCMRGVPECAMAQMGYRKETEG